jgi:hypothetical protein
VYCEDSDEGQRRAVLLLKVCDSVGCGSESMLAYSYPGASRSASFA